MQVIHHVDFPALIDSFISLITAFILGGLIGLERQYRQRTAGLRTNVLVAVGSAIFVDLANRLQGNSGAVQVVAYVVSGVSFLGAGVIMREEGNVRGLNTAATLWGSSAVGATAGADLILEAFLATIFVLFANTLLRPVANMINRKPITMENVEVTNTLYIITQRSCQRKMLTLLEEELKQSNTLPRMLSVHTFGNDEIQIKVVLSDNAIEINELDNLVQRLSDLPTVQEVFWNPSTTE